MRLTGSPSDAVVILAKAGTHFVLALILASVPVLAQPASYPAKAVRFIVPNPPGGGTDLVARIVSQKVSEKWGVNLILDNRPGAGGIIAVEVAAHSAPDGYTLLVGHFPLAVSVNLAKVSFDPVRDFAPVTLLATTQNVLVVNPAVAATSVKELVALAKAKPGELRYASGGNGTAMHLSAELFDLLGGLRMTHVAYKGAGPALADLISGQVQVSFVSLPAAMPQVKSGRIRALAVTGPKRSQTVPALPTVAEAGLQGYAAEQWYGVLVPRQTPRGIIVQLNRDFVWAIHQPNTRERLLDSGYEIAGDTSEEGFDRFIRGEIAKWGEVIRKAGIRAD
jgi:tripartite-type tricarboxylate transporter receptor subunit TctC